MILDTSVLVAMVLAEPGSDQYYDLIGQARRPRMSAGNWLEACIVIDRRGGGSLRARLEAFAQTLGIEIVPFTAEHADRARAAYRRFGKGNHPARLNFGDCIAFATAEAAGEPLLYKGDDFAHPEVAGALGALGRGG